MNLRWYERNLSCTFSAIACSDWGLSREAAASTVGIPAGWITLHCDHAHCVRSPTSYIHDDLWCAHWRSQVLLSSRRLAEPAEVECGVLHSLHTFPCDNLKVGHDDFLVRPPRLIHCPLIRSFRPMVRNTEVVVNWLNYRAIKCGRTNRCGGM
jgi:hypothetical protein